MTWFRETLSSMAICCRVLKRASVITIFLSIVGGCVATPSEGPTRYAKFDRPGGASYGYSDKYLGDDEFSILAAGNRETSKQRVAEIALLRAARLAEERGRTHFLVLNRKSETQRVLRADYIPVVMGGFSAWIPVSERRLMEPVCVLLIRVLPLQTVYPQDAVDAAAAIEHLAGRVE